MCYHRLSSPACIEPCGMRTYVLQKGSIVNRRKLLKLGASGLLGGAVSAAMRSNAMAAGSRIQLIKPQTTDAILVNPGMGFETFHCFNGDERLAGARNYPECSIAYFRFYWDRLEPEEGKYDFELIDSLLERARQSGQDLALRFMPTSSANLNKGTPRWYMDKYKGYRYTKRGRKGWAPDHNDPVFLARQQQLVAAFGERYNGHPNLIRMEIGSVGFWGEWHLSHTEPQVPMITEDNALRVIDTYFDCWDRTPLAMLIGYVPGLRYAVAKGAGWRADSLGDYGHWSDTWCHMFDAYPRKLREAGALDAWKRGPVAFEPPGSMQDLERYVPSRGGGYDNMWDKALEWHGSACNPKSGSIPDSQVPAIERFLKRCGYRLALNRVVLPETVDKKNRKLHVTLDFENKGVAPPYKGCVLAVRLQGAREPIVLHSLAQTSQWLPGTHGIEETFLLPAAVGSGMYECSVGLLEPTGGRPVIRLANEDVGQDRWLRLGRIRLA